MTKPTRRQHYVPRKYLKAWADNNDLVYCKMGNDVKPINIINVGLEKDIYAYKVISKDSFDLVEKLFVKDIEANKKYFNLYKSANYIKNLKNFNNEEQKTLDKLMKEFDEMSYCLIESDLFNFLEKVCNKDLTFCKDFEERVAFLLSISEQYFRTKRMKENLIKTYEDNEVFNGEEIWYLTKHMSSVYLTKSLMQHKFKIYLLINNTKVPFIAGDQPVINSKDNTKNELELYYPISPTLAILISIYNENEDLSFISLKEEDVNLYNLKIKEHSLLQIYANEETILLNL